MEPPKAVKDLVARVVQRLVLRDYAGVAALTRGIDMSEAAIRQAIAEYGRTLRMPPEAQARWLDAVLVKGSAPPRWSVRVDLWTLEEGRSDLSALLWITETPGEPVVELEDLHVL